MFDEDEFLKRYFNIKYLYGNVEEEEMGLLYRNNNFEIWGVTRTPDRSDCYMTVYLNGFMNNGHLNEDPIVCRVSIREPKYINNPAQPNIKFNKKQKKLFIEYMKYNWGNVLFQLFCSSDNLGIKLDMNDIMSNWICPRYELLETV